MTNAEIISAIESMTILELADLVKEMEEKFGVSAAPVAVAGAVFANQCENFSFPDVQRNIIVGQYPRKLHGNMIKLNYGILHLLFPHFLFCAAGRTGLHHDSII